MREYKAVINIISSRVQCLPHCLESLWVNYNSKFNYDVVVYYFDDIYDNEDLRNEITQSTEQNVLFKSVPYKTPSFILEKDLFYNRNEIQYVKSSFPISRKGYLHMCNFTSNMYSYEKSNCKNYDFIITHDDEAGYLKNMDFNPIDSLENEDALFGAYSFGQRLKNGKPHQGHLDTRIGLFNFCRNFLKKYDLSPKSKTLQKILKSNNPEYDFHFLEWADTYVINKQMFNNNNWKNWIKEVNKSGGVYRYRWGDNEIYSLFAHIFLEKIINLNVVNDGYHDQGLFRHLCDLAPGVKNLEL